MPNFSVGCTIVSDLLNIFISYDYDITGWVFCFPSSCSREYEEEEEKSFEKGLATVFEGERNEIDSSFTNCKVNIGSDTPNFAIE